MKAAAVLLVVLAAGTLAGSGAHAALFTLTDLNTTFKVDTDYLAGQWYVDGQAELYRQGFWWRLGPTGNDGRVGDLYTSANRIADNILQVDYTRNPNFDLRITYTLTGGSPGSHSSDVAESIRIHNKTGHTLDLRFFQYADFDLDGPLPDDELISPDPNRVSQRDKGSRRALSETVAVLSGSHHQGGYYPRLVNWLDSGNRTTLSDLPPIGDGWIVGDVAWVYQWDAGLGTTDFLISKDKTLSEVPEPATLVLLGFGLLGAEIARRRRRT